MDYLKELSIQLGGKIHIQNLHNWNHNGTSVRVLTVKNYKGFKIEVDEYEKILDIHIICLNIASDFAFAINIPNKINALTKPSTVDNFPYNIYLSIYNDPTLFENVDFQSFWNPFSKMVSDLNFSDAEGVFFYNGEIYLALSYERDVLGLINRTIDMVNANPILFYEDKTERIFKKNITENLRHLIPLLKKWSIPDDSEREQLMEEISETQKKKLIKAVWPFMAEINDFLNSFGDEPLNYEACLLGNLAELVSELQIENI